MSQWRHFGDILETFWRHFGDIWRHLETFGDILLTGWLAILGAPLYNIYSIPKYMSI